MSIAYGTRGALEIQPRRRVRAPAYLRWPAVALLGAVVVVLVSLFGVALWYQGVLERQTQRPGYLRGLI